MNKKLIFLDIDGTLTEAGSNVPPESALIAVRRAMENGHKVFLCTGRNPAMLAPVLKYGFDGAVACGGGYIFTTDEVLYDCPMTEEQRVQGMEILKRNGVFRTVEAKDITYGDEDLADFLAEASEGNSELIRWRKALAEELNIHSMSEYDGRPIYKIVFMCRKHEQLAEAKAALGDQFNFVVQDVAAHNCLNGELVNRKFDKGRGVKIVAKHYGIPIEDTIGFGDSMNDLEMIQTVGMSVCMDNGSPLLKKESKMVCPAVTDDGLFKAFTELGLI
ncbi:MAG: HAD family hydrolase [Sphaerochaetaceae bacterium]|nr:HAD family hydrolase [Sphaerochaetaceae bacterium]